MKAIALALFAAVLAAPAPAQDSVRTERVQFKPGTSAATLKGAVAGYAGVNYVVGVRAGQTLTVVMRSDNPSSYFNILAPNAREAMFVGPLSGHEFRGKLVTGGDYTVQVYLMRNAARRGETANYVLGVAATG